MAHDDLASVAQGLDALSEGLRRVDHRLLGVIQDLETARARAQTLDDEQAVDIVVSINAAIGRVQEALTSWHQDYHRCARDLAARIRA